MARRIATAGKEQPADDERGRVHATIPHMLQRIMRAERLAGRLIIGGFAGTRVDDTRFARALARGERGGFVIFSRNLEVPERALEPPPRMDARDIKHAVSAMVAALVAKCRTAGLEPIAAVDQEGGRVARLRGPFVTLPAMRHLALEGDAAVYAKHREVGAELSSLGFTSPLAPVLDVDSHAGNPVIGDRSFGDDPTRVAALGVAAFQGLEAGGVFACGKHFPGHGDTEHDSHHALPHVTATREVLEGRELVPFVQAIGRGIPALMTAHVVFEALDRENPATLSRVILTDLLRGKLGFRGVLLSDDLEMKAVAAKAAVEEIAVCAVEAGCDGVLVCADEEAQDRTLDHLARRIDRVPSFRMRAEEACARLNALAKRFPSQSRV